MYKNSFSKLENQHVRHQATHKVDCQPDGSIWSPQASLFLLLFNGLSEDILYQCIMYSVSYQTSGHT